MACSLVGVIVIVVVFVDDVGVTVALIVFFLIGGIVVVLLVMCVMVVIGVVVLVRVIVLVFLNLRRDCVVALPTNLFKYSESWCFVCVWVLWVFFCL